MVRLFMNCSGYSIAPSACRSHKQFFLQPGDLLFQLCRVQCGVFGFQSLLGFQADARHSHQSLVRRSRLVKLLLGLGPIALLADQFYPRLEMVGIQPQMHVEHVQQAQLRR